MNQFFYIFQYVLKIIDNEFIKNYYVEKKKMFVEKTPSNIKKRKIYSTIF